MAQTKTQENTFIKPDYGLSTQDLEGTRDLLCRILADQHILYMKTRKFHWNVTGQRFLALHELFEDQYDMLAEQIDETAERIRQYGMAAPGTFTEMLELTNLSESPGHNPDTRGMVEMLVEDHERTIRTLREYADRAADEFEDAATEDYFVGLIQTHQDIAWMLRAHLEGGDSL